MRWFCLVLMASVALGAPERSQKGFSLFSVVTFPNEECTTTMSTAMNGVCQTIEECSSNSGAASGNCASGFGVCCFYSVDTCGTTVTNNVTYLQNVGYPSTFSTINTNCQFTIRGGSDICQIRLDFDAAVLEPPSAVGVCTDTFSAISPSTYSPPVLCGILTGSHMYVETARADVGATININTGVGVSGRSWKIKVRMIECNNPGRAPTDCVQYMTGTGGRFKSFNNPEGIIQNQEYEICLRQEIGMCSFELSEAASANPFSLDPAGAAVVGAACDTSWITVQTTLTSDKYCGGKLNEVTANTLSGTVVGNRAPFRVGFVAVVGAETDTGGFDLVYRQRPCVA
jgi:hypothetical protein